MQVQIVTSRETYTNAVCVSLMRKAVTWVQEFLHHVRMPCMVVFSFMWKNLLSCTFQQVTHTPSIAAHNFPFQGKQLFFLRMLHSREVLLWSHCLHGPCRALGDACSLALSSASRACNSSQPDWSLDRSAFLPQEQAMRVYSLGPGLIADGTESGLSTLCSRLHWLRCMLACMHIGILLPSKHLGAPRKAHVCATGSAVLRNDCRIGAA
jgi:hypothetical protein